MSHFVNTEFACGQGRCSYCGGVYRTEPRLLEALEMLRESCGNYPVQILSGYRCLEHNRIVGGAPSSMHLQGLAADIQIRNHTGEDIVATALKIPYFRGFGAAALWAHVDVRTGPISKWRYDEFGKTVPWDYSKVQP